MRTIRSSPAQPAIIACIALAVALGGTSYAAIRFPANSVGTAQLNPHTFLSNISGAPAPIALAAHQQVAAFLAGDGAVTIDPDGPAPPFETPIADPLPETLNFIP